MAKDQKRNLTGIHLNQYEFWSKLQQTNSSVYKNDIQGRQFYDMPITKDGWIIRLDIYFLRRDYDKKGYITIAVMNNNKQLYDTQLQKMINCFEDVENPIYYEDLYRNKYYRYVVGTKNVSFLLTNHQNWDNAIKWFNDHITNLISLLRL